VCETKGSAGFSSHPAIKIQNTPKKYFNDYENNQKREEDRGSEAQRDSDDDDKRQIGVTARFMPKWYALKHKLCQRGEQKYLADTNQLQATAIAWVNHYCVHLESK